MRTRPALAALGFVLTTGACGSDDSAPTPTAPPPPPAVPGPTPTRPPDLRPPPEFVLRPGGVFYAPYQVLELTPGAAAQIELTAHPRTFYADVDGPFAPVPAWATFAVETDAPPTVLRVRRWIERREVVRGLPDPGEMERGTVRVGIVELQAIAVGTGEHAQAIHEVRIDAPAGGFPGPFAIEVDAAPIRFRVVPPRPAVVCDELALTARSGSRSGEPGRFFRRLFEDVGDFNTGRITVGASGFGVGLRLLAPYRLRGGELRDTAWDPSAQRQTDEVGFPFLFAAGMDLRPAGGGFEQTFDLGWFDELELLAHAPGCEPRRIRCDIRGACSTE